MNKTIGTGQITSEGTLKNDLLVILDAANKDVLDSKVAPIEDAFESLRIMLNNKEVEIIIVPPEEKDKYLTEADKEMDRRFDEAVAEAIVDLKAKGLPIAQYDNELKKAYFEMPDGTREYID